VQLTKPTESPPPFTASVARQGSVEFQLVPLKVLVRHCQIPSVTTNAPSATPWLHSCSHFQNVLHPRGFQPLAAWQVQGKIPIAVGPRPFATAPTAALLGLPTFTAPPPRLDTAQARHDRIFAQPPTPIGGSRTLTRHNKPSAARLRRSVLLVTGSGAPTPPVDHLPPALFEQPELRSPEHHA